MPELPDIAVYAEALARRVEGATLVRLRIRSPFLLRTFDPPADACEGLRVCRVTTLAKRIVLDLEHDLFVVIHLMIAGRLRWSPAPVPVPRATKIDLAWIEFSSGTLTITEASEKKRASLHVLRGREALRALDRGGVDLFTCTPDEFHQALTRENRTLKRALTDPRLCRGVGNSYSDEILHAARLSPLRRTGAMTPDETRALLESARSTLAHWLGVLRAQFKLDQPGDGVFPGPGEITAFRPDFAVHGKFSKACPVCGAPVQRIVSSQNECNYCPGCQTEGKILADRSMSRLLGDDWPRSLDELE